ncbi:uncharacterized protein [Panulirus ornatus]|uniref:uncharacterized protein n=1 Tax=Panulirus ornatus TaxID=150431 RepID=UPI003A848A00
MMVVVKVTRGFSDGANSRTKVETWPSITQQINAAFPCFSRTVEQQVQKRYHNIISSGKNKIATHKRLFCKTGGGRLHDKPLLDPLSHAVAGILGADSPSITGISGCAP